MAAPIRVKIAKITSNDGTHLNNLFDPFWLLVSSESHPFIRDVENKIISVCSSLIASKSCSETNQDFATFARFASDENTVRQTARKSRPNTCQLWLDGCRLLDSEKTGILRDNDSISVHLTVTERYGKSQNNPKGINNEISQNEIPTYSGENRKISKKRKHSDHSKNESFDNTPLERTPEQWVEFTEKNSKVKSIGETSKHDSENNDEISLTKKKRRKMGKEKRGKNKKTSDDVLGNENMNSSNEDMVEEEQKYHETEAEIPLHDLIAQKIKEIKNNLVSVNPDNDLFIKSEKKKSKKKLKEKPSDGISPKSEALDSSISSSNIIAEQKSEDKQLSPEDHSLQSGLNASNDPVDCPSSDDVESNASFPVEKKKRTRRRKKKKKSEKETPKVIRVEDKPRSSILNLPRDQQPQNTKVVFDSDTSEDEPSMAMNSGEAKHLASDGSEVLKKAVKDIDIDTKSENKSILRTGEDKKEKVIKNEKTECDTTCNTTSHLPSPKKSRRFMMKSTMSILSSIKTESPSAASDTGDHSSNTNIPATESKEGAWRATNTTGISRKSHKYLMRSTVGFLDSLNSTNEDCNQFDGNDVQPASGWTSTNCVKVTTPGQQTAVQDFSRSPTVLHPRSNRHSTSGRTADDVLISKQSSSASIGSKGEREVTDHTNIDPNLSAPSPFLSSQIDSSPTSNKTKQSSSINSRTADKLCADPDSRFAELLQRKRLNSSSCTVTTTSKGLKICSRNSSPKFSNSKDFVDPANDVLTNRSMLRKNTSNCQPSEILLKPPGASPSHLTNGNCHGTGDKVEVIPLDIEKCPCLEGKPHKGDIVAYKMLEMSEDYTPIVSDFKTAKVISCDASDSVCLEILFGSSEQRKKSGKFELTFEGEEDMIAESEMSSQESIPLSSMMDTRLVQREEKA